MVRPPPLRLAALRRPPARGCAALGLWFSVGLAGCGAGPAQSGAAVHPEPASSPARSRSVAHASHLVDLTERPGAAMATVLVGLPTRPADRVEARARLSALRPRLAKALADARPRVETDSIGGVPVLRLEVSMRAYEAALDALVATFDDATPPSADASPMATLPGDALDALSSSGGSAGRPAIVIVRGPLPPDRTAREAKALDALGARFAGGERTAAPSPSPPPGPAVRVLRRGGGAAHLALAVRLPGGTRTPDADLLAALLSGGPESRLERAVTSAGLEGAFPAAGLRPGPGGAELILGLTLRPDDTETGWRLLAAVRRGLGDSPPTSAEVARARAHLADRDAFARGTTSALAHHRAARLFRTDDALPDEAEFAVQLDAVTTGALGRLAAEVATAAVRGVLVTPAVEASVDDDLWAESLALAARAEAPAVLSAPEVRPGVFRLSEGLSAVVLVRPGDTLVAFAVRLDGGASVEPPEFPGVGVLSAAVAGRAAEHGAFEIDGRYERDAVVLTVTAPAERVSEAIELLARRLSRFPQRADVLESARTRLIARRANRQSDPLALAFALAEQGFSDPRLGRDLLGTPDGLADRTPIEVRSFLEARVAGRPTTVTVVGPVDPARVLPMIRSAFSPLAAEAPVSDAPSSVPAPARLERRVEADRTCVAAAFALPPATAREEGPDAAAEVLATLLAPARRLFGPSGPALAVARCADDVAAARIALATDVGRLATSGPTPPALAAARETAAAEFARVADPPAGLAVRISEAVARGRSAADHDPVARAADRLEAVTPTEVRALASALPPLDAAVTGVAGPTPSP